MVEESLSDWLSVSEAAAALGLTRQRVGRLVADGVLRAKRVGAQDLVLRDDVEMRLDQGPASGRRYSPRRAWALILLASGGMPPALDDSTLSKLRSVLRREDLWDLRPRLASRAERRNLRAHSTDLARIDAEPGVLRTGARHAADAGLAIVASDAPVELYVDAETAGRLEARYRLRPSARPNVILRVVPTAVRSWLPGPIAPRVAVALDLADDRDPRSRLVAREALTRS